MDFHYSSFGSVGDLECHYGKESDSYKYIHEQFTIITELWGEVKNASRDQKGGGYILFCRLKYRYARRLREREGMLLPFMHY